MRYIKLLSAAAVCAALSFTLVSCEEDDISSKGDSFVVYGNIYTADSALIKASAFVVQNGKYVYVGNEEGAKAYIDADTKVIRQETGMVMPGCTEAHGHYITDAAYNMLVYLDPDNSFEQHLDDIRRYYNANKGKIKQIMGFGWSAYNMQESEFLRIRAALDSITTDIPIFLSDHEMHQAWVNTKTLTEAGVAIVDKKAEDKDLTVVAGGTVFRQNGVATGRTQDQANGYVRLKAFKNPMATESQYLEACETAVQRLLSQGYTNYFDAWLSYDNTDGAFKALHALDKQKKLPMNVVGTYEIDSYRVNSTKDYIPLIDEALAWKKAYSSEHFFPTNVKFFADGCTESGTGYVKEAYPEIIGGGHGICNWKNQNLFDEVVKYVNDHGMLVHTHTYGDAAVEYVVNAYEKSYQAGNTQIRNGLAHVGNITDNDLKRVKACDITVAENACWHASVGIDTETMVSYLGEKYRSLYPMQSFYDNGILMASSTDYPCSVGFPTDPFSVMEIMLTGINPLNPQPESTVYGRQELITLDKALQAMTINGAWALGLEKTRGSITVGKSADFIIINRDLFSTPAKELHNTRVLSTYFEGKRVY